MAKKKIATREKVKPEKKETSTHWLAEPEEHDYPAAQSYLTLLLSETEAQICVKRLRRAPVVEFKAKDIFRASELPMLPVTNSHVRQDQQRIETGQRLAPLLLVRDPGHGKVIIADGYHRLCAVYFYDEDAVVPCKIV